ncbi:hypothetical protein [Micromonospora arborensis]|uniref:hypothetical protein n=1 Tax=Micromonospora arborensis TaxID=2116518 RepID=UPI00371206AB
MPLTRRAFTLGALSTNAATAGVLSLPRAALAARNTAYVMASADRQDATFTITP